jgi:hypothetical protein
VGLAIHWHPTPLDDPTSKLFWTRVTNKGYERFERPVKLSPTTQYGPMASQSQGDRVAFRCFFQYRGERKT